MLAYNLKLAAMSLRRNPVISLLMVLAIGVGIGACMTMMTIHHQLSGNPLQHKNDILYAVQLDSGDPQEKPTLGKKDVPFWLTYRDATNLIDAVTPAKRQIITMETLGNAQVDADSKAEAVHVRATYSDFFQMFDAPFKYGRGWTREDDNGSQQLVVLGADANRRLFGGQNSVGRNLQIQGQNYQVTGVLENWDLVPKPYQPYQFAPDDIFIPFKPAIKYELLPAGPQACWKGYNDYTFKAVLNSECSWISVWVELENPQQIQDYRDYLNRYVEEQKRYGRFQRPINNFLSDMNEWITLHDTGGAQLRLLLVLAILFLVICVVNTVGLLLSKFLGRSHEISLKRALGANRQTIFMQSITEVGLLGFCGGLLGIGLSLLSLQAIRSIIADGSNLTAGVAAQLFHMDWQMLMMAIAISILAGMLAGLYPAWRVCQLPPAQYLRIQ